MKRFLALCIAFTSLVFNVSAKTVVDIAGREVIIPENAQNIILGEGRLFSALALLDGENIINRIVGWQGDLKRMDGQTYNVWSKKFTNMHNIALIGNGSANSVSGEKVLTLNPDVAIFGLSGHGPNLENPIVQQLNQANIPVVFIDFRSNPGKNTLPSMKILGEVLGREQKAQEFIDFYTQNLQKVTQKVQSIPSNERKTVFIETRPGGFDSCCHTAGNGNMGDFIDYAGGINIAKDKLNGLGQLNLEAVLAANPDIYIATGGAKADADTLGIKAGSEVSEDDMRESLNEVISRDGIKDLSAIKNNNSYAIWHNFYNSPFNILAIQAMATWFYPDYFQELNPEDTMKEMYKQFLPIETSGTFWSKKQ